MKKLTTIPLPTVPLIQPTAVRTRSNGLGWQPRKDTTRDANVALINASRYNKVAGPLSILNTATEEDLT